VVVILIVGCLLLSCMVGGLWFLYSVGPSFLINQSHQNPSKILWQRQKQSERPPSNVQYYPYYVPPAGSRGGVYNKDVEMSTEFR
jgi:hypothetical protein